MTTMLAPQQVPASVKAYLTVPMMKARPTTLALKTLVNGGDQAAQDAELHNVLCRASRWCDNEANRTLGAASFTSQTRLRADRYGYLNLDCDSAPVRKVLSVSAGTSPSALTALVLDEVEFDGSEQGYVIRLPLTGAGALSTLGLSGLGLTPTSRLLVRWTYEAGYPTTYLTATASSAATTLTVADTVGMVAGDVLTIADGSSTEQVVVTATPAAGATTVAVSPTTATHTYTAGVAARIGVYAMPEDMIDAVGLAASGLIKQRSVDSVVMERANTPSRGMADPTGQGMDFKNARMLLDRYQRKGR